VALLAVPDDHMEEVLREYQEQQGQTLNSSSSEVIVRPAELSPPEWQEVTRAQQ
jgi:hypothetical protein